MAIEDNRSITTNMEEIFLLQSIDGGGAGGGGGGFNGSYLTIGAAVNQQYGIPSVSVGEGSFASGINSFAYGYNNVAGNFNSFSLGVSNTNLQQNAYMIGNGNFGEPGSQNGYANLYFGETNITDANIIDTTTGLTARSVSYTNNNITYRGVPKKIYYTQTEMRDLTNNGDLSIGDFCIAPADYSSYNGKMQVFRKVKPEPYHDLTDDERYAFGDVVIYNNNYYLCTSKISGFKQTQDSEIVENKKYYTRTGTGTSEDPYIYTLVASPVQQDLPIYFDHIEDWVPWGQDEWNTVSFNSNNSYTAGTIVKNNNNYYKCFNSYTAGREWSIYNWEIMWQKVELEQVNSDGIGYVHIGEVSGHADLNSSKTWPSDEDYDRYVSNTHSIVILNSYSTGYTDYIYAGSMRGNGYVAFRRGKTQLENYSRNYLDMHFLEEDYPIGTYFYSYDYYPTQTTDQYNIFVKVNNATEGDIYQNFQSLGSYDHHAFTTIYGYKNEDSFYTELNFSEANKIVYQNGVLYVDLLKIGETGLSSDNKDGIYFYYNDTLIPYNQLSNNNLRGSSQNQWQNVFIGVGNSLIRSGSDSVYQNAIFGHNNLIENRAYTLHNYLIGNGNIITTTKDNNTSARAQYNKIFGEGNKIVSRSDVQNNYLFGKNNELIATSTVFPGDKKSQKNCILENNYFIGENIKLKTNGYGGRNNFFAGKGITIDNSDNLGDSYDNLIVGEGISFTGSKLYTSQPLSYSSIFGRSIAIDLASADESLMGSTSNPTNYFYNGLVMGNNINIANARQAGQNNFIGQGLNIGSVNAGVPTIQYMYNTNLYGQNVNLTGANSYNNIIATSPSSSSDTISSNTGNYNNLMGCGIKNFGDKNVILGSSITNSYSDNKGKLYDYYKNYAYGDIVVYPNSNGDYRLYKCIDENGSAKGAWKQEKWQLVGENTSFTADAGGYGNVLIGRNITNSGNNNIVIGSNITLSSDYSNNVIINSNFPGGVALGGGTQATSKNAFACGGGSIASGQGAFACNEDNHATGSNSFAAGAGTYATGSNATAFGGGTTAEGYQSFAIGGGTHAIGSNSFAGGGASTAAGGNTSFAFGGKAQSYGINSVTFGGGVGAYGQECVSIGGGNQSFGSQSFAFGQDTIANGKCCTSFGQYTQSGITPNALKETGLSNNIDLYSTTRNYVVDEYCIYESILYKCISDTNGDFDSNAWENILNSGQSYNTTFGYGTMALGTANTAIGFRNEIVGGGYSFIGGLQSKAKGYMNFLYGYYLDNGSDTQYGTTYQTIIGSCNQPDSTKAFIIGNGTNVSDVITRSNALTVDWDGNQVLAGKLTIGAAPTANMDVTTKQYVDNIRENNEGLVANTYSDSSTYAAGAYAIYEHVLYRCTTPVTAAETFDPAKWTAIKLADRVAILDNDINNTSLGLKRRVSNLETQSYCLNEVSEVPNIPVDTTQIPLGNDYDADGYMTVDIYINRAHYTNNLDYTIEQDPNSGEFYADFNLSGTTIHAATDTVQIVYHQITTN